MSFISREEFMCTYFEKLKHRAIQVCIDEKEGLPKEDYVANFTLKANRIVNDLTKEV